MTVKDRQSPDFYFRGRAVALIQLSKTDRHSEFEYLPVFAMLNCVYRNRSIITGNA